MRAPTVLLFDIDGTLVTTGGAGRRAIERAFETVTGIRDAMRFSFGGMTDRAIVRAGLESAELVVSEAAIDELLAVYLGVLPEEVERAREYFVHPGMREAVVTARQTRGVAVGLGTGNVRAGARIKLERVSLYDQFAFGGFGCDHEDRAELLRVGAERGAAALGVERGECRVVVIGDTVRDVDAALRIGAECIGVGTGVGTPETLSGRGATAVFATLAVPGALEALLG